MDRILQSIRQDVRKAPPGWTIGKSIPTAAWKWIQKEVQSDSEFDALRLRYHTLHHPERQMLYATCPFGSVFVIYSDKTFDPIKDIPWDLWGRILRLFYRKQPSHIYFLANPSLRRFPSSSSSSSSIKPEHINGGYTYPCRQDTIVIYRAEDATRVLIHELQHALCLDHQERGVDRVEAETEAWAELFYTALLARGDPTEWKRLWSRQWKWILEQNRQVARHMRSPFSQEFPWRYTLGKEQALRGWFLPSSLSSPSRTQGLSPTSLRLTAPPTRKQKQEQGVRASSTVL
jgi:hypothetical protein